MLYLLFQLGKDRYALAAAQIIEVLPRVQVKQLPQAHPALAGAINYHGESVPLIDLSQIALGRQANRRLSTRIVLVNYPDAQNRSHRLGLLAERATETVVLAAERFQDSGVDTPGAPYLGPVAMDASGMIQRVELDRLLPEALRNVLFPLAIEA